MRDPKRAQLPDDVATVVGDATRVDDVVRAVAGADATMFCVNPPVATWLTTFPPLLECAITAARQTNTRLMFPANVWNYGPVAPAISSLNCVRRRQRRSEASCVQRWSGDLRSRHSLRDRSLARVLGPSVNR